MKIKLFATLKERAQAGEIELAVDGDGLTVAALRQAIAQQHPALAPLARQALVAVNREFAFNHERVKTTDEVALFPPVSGGAPDETVWPEILEITPAPIDLNALQQAITTPDDGAVVIFTGTVRARTRGRDGDQVTSRLEYEAYTDMAAAKLRQVAREMRARFPAIHGIALAQRVGEMAIGEPTVAVAASAGHRGDGAFEAARYGIDRLKQIVPVWKRETRPDGSSWVEGDYTPTPADRIADGNA